MFIMLRVFASCCQKVLSGRREGGKTVKEGGEDGREAEYGERRVRERMKEGRNKQRDREVVRRKGMKME